MNDCELSRTLQLSRSSSARRGWRCPRATRWVAYVEARLQPGERARLEAHLADCAFCLGQVGFLVRTADLGPPPAVPSHLLGAGRKVKPRFALGLRPVAVTMAGASVLALALFVLPPQRGSLAPQDTSSPTAETVRRSAPAGERVGGSSAPALGAPLLLRPVEGEVVAGTAFELQWQAAPDALFYTVQLMNPRGDVVWEGDVQGTRLAVPPAIGLGPGQPLLAWVVAHHRSGAAVRSPVVSFRLAPG